MSTFFSKMSNTITKVAKSLRIVRGSRVGRLRIWTSLMLIPSSGVLIGILRVPTKCLSAFMSEIDVGNDVRLIYCSFCHVNLEVGELILREKEIEES